jgi:RNA 3'-phosphate cyclase
LIKVDGSYGEGGGAVLRITTALSAVTSKPVHITNIRAGRPKPGLMPQHLNAVKSIADLSSASVSGLELGSTEIIFNPGILRGGNYNIDVKTAGSITLILQAFMIPAAFADDPVNITIIGGTDVRWSPSVDYLENVTLPILRLMGYNAKTKMKRRGHYPRGGGILELTVEPIRKLKPIKRYELNFKCIKGISHAVKLPEHVALRQANSAIKILSDAGYPSEIDVQHSDNALGPGSGIMLWTDSETPVSGSSIGKPGKPAEKVGADAAKEILYHISRSSAIDSYMGDQIIPYLSLAGHSIVKTAELTQHALTNIYVAQKFIKKNIKVDGNIGDSTLISVK